ncbi:anti-sigma factor domain-containing protein [Amycolatopsis sp. NPDC059657]|uniref:anti-sigma factor n=1 Tax=Amycolatopsis sp. NPDC059657 TaxID=3346899 RepID=UPI00366B416C
MSSPEMHTLAGAFAVNALSEHERARFQRHIEECESCAQEVRELRATAARLGAAVAEEQTSPQLKARVLAEVRATRQEPPTARPEPEESVRTAARVPRWALILSTAAAVIGLALAGVFGGIALNTQNRLETAQSKYAPVAELLAAPDAQTLHGRSAIGGGGTVVMSPSLDKMMFMASKLPSPGDRDYQVWLIQDGKARSAGVLPKAAGGQLVLASGLTGTTQVAVTLEPPGGSPEPTTDPFLRVFTA